MGILSGTISFLLDSPVIFKIFRKLVAPQGQTKDFVKRYINKYPPKTILDIGFGTGDFMDTIPEDTLYTGIDNNPKYFSYAINNLTGEKREFLLKDALDDDIYSNKSFDIVLMISILHHLSDQELGGILPNIKKVAKKAVIIADIIPNPPGLIPKLLVKLDRGKFVRSEEEKLRILGKYFKVTKTTRIPQGLGVQFGIICET